jgi:protocatechuate 3,4-dioxygenase beta subunit
MLTRLGFILVLFFELSAQANTKAVDPIIAQCHITPATRQNLPYPSNFVRTNNLVTKTGSFISANGDGVIIAGRVMDKNCVPMSNTVIRFWQADSKGLISYQTDDKNVEQNGDMNFAGSGVANTDNLGRFILKTINPGLNKKNQTSKYVNFMIENGNHTLITKGYFDLQSANLDPEYSQLKDQNKAVMIFASASPNSSPKVFNIDIVVDYAQTNRTY